MLQTVLPIGLVFLCLLLAVAAAWLLYRKKNYTPVWKRYLLQILRTFSLFLILLLLLSPFIKFKSNRTENPLFIVGLDHSKSITAADRKWQEDLQKQLEPLKGKLDIKYFHFGEISTALSDTQFNDLKSNIGSSFDYVNTVYDGKNSAGMLLCTDGIVNSGINPLFRNLNKQSAIYTIGLGDSTPYPDLKVQSALANEIVFYQNEFSVLAGIKASEKWNLPVTVQLLEDGAVLQTKLWNPNSGGVFTELEFICKANKVGLHKYTVLVQSTGEEKNKTNNQKSVYVQVTDTRKKIKILFESPHPDIAAINRALETAGNFQVSTGSINQQAGIANVDILIVHNLPVTAAHASLIKQFQQANIPVLFFTGIKTNWTFLNALCNFQYRSAGEESVQETQAVWNADFVDFSIPNNWINTIQKLPPLKMRYGSFAGQGSLSNLFVQRIGSVSTNFPLIAFTKNGKTKNAFVFGEGIWRWRMKNFVQESDQEAVDGLVKKICQYVSTDELKQNFKLWSDKQEYDYKDKVSLHAEFYDNSASLNNDANCEVTLRDEKNFKQKFSMGKFGKAYRVDVNNLEPGNYTAEARINNGGNQVATTKFTVVSHATELAETQADFNLLRSIAGKNNGAFYHKNEVSKLLEVLNKKEFPSTIVSEQKIYELIDLKWFFAIIVAMLTAEWFIRRREGGY